MVLVPRISRWDLSMPRTTVRVSPAACSTSTAVTSPVINGMGTPSLLTRTLTGVTSCKPPGSSTRSGLPRKTSLNWEGTNMVLSTSTDTRAPLTSGLRGTKPTRTWHWELVTVKLIGAPPSRQGFRLAPVRYDQDCAHLDAHWIVDVVGLG